MLPRYHNCRAWNIEGCWVMTNARMLPKRVDRVMHKVMCAIGARDWIPPIEMVDVTGDNVYVLHRSVSAKKLMWMFKRNWSWQNWRRYRLPNYIRHKGKLIIWNGTHRMTLARFANRKVRARVYDVDKFFAWCKEHPLKERRIIVKPKKKVKNRGH